MDCFKNIKAQDCEIIEVYNDGASILIKHPDFPRNRIFTKSRKGNYYWTKPLKDDYGSKEIWIIQGELLH